MECKDHSVGCPTSNNFTLDEMRPLSEEERCNLAHPARLFGFKRQQLLKNMQTNWDKFYKRHNDRFFKNRNWTLQEFPELFPPSQKLSILEVGCGVGNFIFPLLTENSNVFCYGCDFSSNALRIAESTAKLYNVQDRCRFVMCDITECSPKLASPSHLRLAVEPEADGRLLVDCATLIFVLSALEPDRMEAAVRHVAGAVRPGGTVLLRDYAARDHAEIRFAQSVAAAAGPSTLSPSHPHPQQQQPWCSKLGPGHYARQDGTTAYYFTVDQCERLFGEAGLRLDYCRYVARRTVNEKERLDVCRLFVQGRFTRPVVT